MLISDIKKCGKLIERVIALDKQDQQKITFYLSTGKSAAQALLKDSGPDPDLDALAAELRADDGRNHEAGCENFLAPAFYWATWLPYCLTCALTALFYFNRKEPVLYSQTRFGKGSVPFRMHKFTTMAGPAFSSAGDEPRVIKPWGAFLRKTSLNELPQRKNLRAGEMAVFGPRPYQEKNRALMEALGAEKRSLLKPGWISLAHQLAHLYGISIRAMALIDVLYVELSGTKYKRALDALALKYTFQVITGAKNK